MGVFADHQLPLRSLFFTRRTPFVRRLSAEQSYTDPHTDTGTTREGEANDHFQSQAGDKSFQKFQSRVSFNRTRDCCFSLLFLIHHFFLGHLTHTED